MSEYSTASQTGLLVVLAGCMTRLVPHLTALDKKYRAVLPRFVGAIPPDTVAVFRLHIAGKRTSDFARTGAAAEIPERGVTVYTLNAVDFSGEAAPTSRTCIARRSGPFAFADAIPADVRAALRPMIAELARQYGLAPLLLADSRAASFFSDERGALCYGFVSANMRPHKT